MSSIPQAVKSEWVRQFEEGRAVAITVEQGRQKDIALTKQIKALKAPVVFGKLIERLAFDLGALDGVDGLATKISSISQENEPGSAFRVTVARHSPFGNMKAVDIRFRAGVPCVDCLRQDGTDGDLKLSFAVDEAGEVHLFIEGNLSVEQASKAILWPIIEEITQS